MKTQQIVINKCYGGFSISIKALIELIEMNADCIDKHSLEDYYGEDYKDEFYKDKKEMDVIGEYLVNNFYCMVIRPLKDKVPVLYRLSNDDSTRTNKDFIKVVNKLGEASYGSCAKLKIIDIPIDVKYSIEEYDGIEWIAEVHRTWK